MMGLRFDTCIDKQVEAGVLIKPLLLNTTRTAEFDFNT